MHNTWQENQKRYQSELTPFVPFVAGEIQLCLKSLHHFFALCADTYSKKRKKKLLTNNPSFGNSAILISSVSVAMILLLALNLEIWLITICIFMIGFLLGYIWV